MSDTGRRAVPSRSRVTNARPDIHPAARLGDGDFRHPVLLRPHLDLDVSVARLPSSSAWSSAAMPIFAVKSLRAVMSRSRPSARTL
jgi:hypothetical protein